MTQSSNGPHKKARIEIIPLIDIMFFLLASFMLVSMSMVKLQKVETKLPNARTGDAQKKQDFKVVGVDAKGNLYYDKDKDPVNINTVTERLAAVYREKKDDAKVFINCDKAVSFNQLVDVLDAIRSTGIKQVNFAVEKSKVSGPSTP